MKSYFRCLVFVFALILISGNAAYACSCAGDSLPCQSYWTTTAIFIGRAISVSPTYEEENKVVNFDVKQNERVFRFAVDRPFKGVTEDEVEVITSIGGGSCGYYFTPGKQYLVYAGFDAKTQQYHTSICSRTRSIENATADLVYIEGLSNAKIKNGISGTVNKRAINLVGRHYSKDLGTAIGIDIAIQSGKRRFIIKTDAEGHYAFRALAPGKYRVFQWNEENKLLSRYTKLARYEVDLLAGSKSYCTGADFIIGTKAQISGKVLDSRNNPVQRVRVSAILADSDAYLKDDRYSSESRISSYTDSDGSYTLKELPPGRYFIGINY